MSRLLFNYQIMRNEFLKTREIPETGFKTKKIENVLIGLIIIML